jgi:hypothetical protein
MTQGPNRTVPAPEPRGATLHLTLDAAEHQRRTESAASPILDPASLDLLLALPVGIPVAVGALSWSQQQAVRRLPRGAADRTRTHVTRQAVRPCRIDLATVSGPPTRKSLGRAGWFAPFCSRTLIIPRVPRRKDFLTEADFWGIGVTLDHAGEREVLVEPEPWVLKRHTPAGWRYVERAYKAATVVAVQEAA